MEEIGLKKFHGCTRDLSEWKAEWKMVTNLVCLNATKIGKNLADIKLSEEKEDE